MRSGVLKRRTAATFVLNDAGAIMTEISDSKSIMGLLAEAGDAGLTGLELKRLTQMNDEEFNNESEKLWMRQRLTGIRKNGCCGRGCGFLCVSYMELDQVWRLIEFRR